MKKNRPDKIIEVIAKNVVETQEQLVALLNKEGYKVTQATVSRDIRKLKLTKQVNAEGISKYVYTTAGQEVMIFLLRNCMWEKFQTESFLRMITGKKKSGNL